MTITRTTETLTTQTPVLPDRTSVKRTPSTARHRRRIIKVLAKKSFCTLATSSPAGNPHVAGVIYEYVDQTLWIHTMTTSRKARSIAANARAAVTVPFRKMPGGPPFTIHFQANAELVPMDSPLATDLLRTGQLKAISGHGALDTPDGVFIRLGPTGLIHSYGPGASTLDLIRDPLHNGFGSFHIDELAL